MAVSLRNIKLERPVMAPAPGETRLSSNRALARIPRPTVVARRVMLLAVFAAILAAPILGFDGISAPATASLLAVLIGAWMARDRAPLLSGACAALAAVVSLPATLIVAWLLLRPEASRRKILVGYVGAAALLVLGFVAMGAVDLGVLSSALIERQTQPGSLPGLVQSTRASGIVPQIAIFSLGLSMLVMALALRKNDRMSYGMVALAGAVASPLVPVPALVMAIGALALWEREPATVLEDAPILGAHDWEKGTPVGARRPVPEFGAVTQMGVDTQ